MSSTPSASPFFHIQPLYEGERVPKIVVAPDGAVLAFAASCRRLRRSTDGGATWSEAVDLPEGCGGNAVVDEVAGDVLIVGGRGWQYRSGDSGVSWTREAMTLEPNALGHGRPDGVPIGAGASESGVTLRAGEHAGRLVMPVRLQPPHGNNDQEFWAYNYNAAIYSDDRGASWRLSDPVQSGTGEGTLAELSDGRIYYNSRCHMAVDHRRRIAWSHDGGHRWTDWQVSEHLYEVGEPFYFKYGTKPSYGINAGLVRLPDTATGGEDVLVFSTPDNPGGARVKMTVWSSADGARTWPAKRLVYEGPCAYSSLAAGEDGTIYLLFENGDAHRYERISLARFERGWLANGSTR
jgi:sialidase-1